MPKKCKPCPYCRQVDEKCKCPRCARCGARFRYADALQPSLASPRLLTCRSSCQASGVVPYDEAPIGVERKGARRFYTWRELIRLEEQRTERMLFKEI